MKLSYCEAKWLHGALAVWTTTCDQNGLLEGSAQLFLLDKQQIISYSLFAAHCTTSRAITANEAPACCKEIIYRRHLYSELRILSLEYWTVIMPTGNKEKPTLLVLQRVSTSNQHTEQFEMSAKMNAFPESKILLHLFFSRDKLYSAYLIVLNHKTSRIWKKVNSSSAN